MSGGDLAKPAGVVADLFRSVVDALTVGEMGDLIERLSKACPIPMRITCPKCGALHVDEEEFATRPHRTHTCQGCGLNWQVSLACTVGVKFLPGCEGPSSGGGGS